MRIIGGERRGKKLLTPPENAGIRPTSDRAREAMFNIIAHQKWVDGMRLHGARVLDLACGTGAFAAEALSRGAGFARLYDKNAAALKIARQNIEALKLPATALVEFADLTRLPPADAPYELIFCDPPYGQGLAEAALGQLAGQGYLTANTLLLIEVGAGEALRLPQGYVRHDVRRYGAAEVHFLGYEG